MRRKTKRRNRKANQRLSQLESLENRTLLTVNAITLDAGPAVVDDAGAGQDRVLRIVNGTPTQDYDSVGIVNGQCSGTLIASNAVLTAAHCVEDGTSAQDFQVEGKTYATDEVFVHEQYSSNDIDLAVMVLNENVTGIDPVDINRTVPEVGQMLTLVGFGATGTANGGHNGDFGVKHVGQTPIDVVTPTEINWNFDNPSESNTAPGDSGGPAFLTQDGNIVVAGVTSGGTQENAGLGDYSFDMRVDAFANWIDGIVQTNGGTAPDPAPAPPTDPGDGQGDQDPGDQDPDTPIEDEAPEDDFSDEFDDEVVDDGDELIQFALDELDLYDQNGDGMMSRRELVNEFMDLGDSRREARDFADYLLGEFDDDGDGKLDLSELAATYGDGDVEVDDDSQEADDPFAEDLDFGWGDDDWGVDDWSSQQEDAYDVFANFGWLWW